MKLNGLKKSMVYGLFFGFCLPLCDHFIAIYPVTAQSIQRVRSWRLRITPKTAKRTGKQVFASSRNEADASNVCGKTNMPLAAIVPAIAIPKDKESPYTHYVSSLTTSEKPTFWFYLPYTIDRQRKAEFTLRTDPNKKRLFEKTVILPTQPGLYAFQLEVPLNAEQEYFWRFAVDCKPGEHSAAHDVEGWIERIDSKALEPALEQAKTPIQKFEAYANQGIWHESMAVLTGEVCRQDRKLAQQHLNDLIREIGLTDIVEKTPQPLLTKCQPVSSP